MPYRLPEGFPHKLSNDEAEDAMTSILAALRERYGDQVSSWLPELQVALISLALSDQSRRQLVTAGQIARASLVVAGAALIVAIVTLIVA